MADRVVVLHQGEIQQIGTPQELYHTPGNQFTAGFIGTPAMNFLTLKKNSDDFLLPDGTLLPIFAEHFVQLQQHQEVVLGLRPEHVFTSSEECRSFQNGGSHNLPQVRINTGINNREMLGSEFLIHTDLNGSTFRFRHKNNQALPVKGESIELYFSLANCHLFDVVTGRKLNKQ